MEKKQEAEQAWREFNKFKSAVEYGKAHSQSNESAEYIQAISYNSRQYGIEDFKLALKAEIEKDINKFGGHEYDMSGHTAAYKKVLSLIDEVKPIQK